MKKLNLIGLNLEELQTFVLSIGDKIYRAQQIFKWIYGKGIDTFDEMTNLSKELRLNLDQQAHLNKLQIVTSQLSSKDKSEKFLFRLQDGKQIESVLMIDDQRTTLCVSTQVGCALDCKFCATGTMGLKRHVTCGEIVDQLLTVQKLSGKSISNVVCMGMGEPFHNYDNLIKACAIMIDDLGPNLAKRHIVISTSGVVPKIVRFTDEGHKYKLAISLNATTDAVRNQIMPINKKWSINELLKAVEYYTNKTGLLVTFEYVLMQGINDSLTDAERLLNIARRISCKINLIPYNATTGFFRRPSDDGIILFYEKMASLHAPVTIRWSKGEDIKAACGQLAVKNSAQIRHNRPRL